MINLAPLECDDAAFLELVQRIINGALVELQMREVFLVYIDNWFDHKWLGWNSRKSDHELRVPQFHPNRVYSEKHFILDEETTKWCPVDLIKPIHLRQPGRPWLAEPLDRLSKAAAFIWYSGNTVTNDVGSLMMYLSGAEMYAWYASFRRREKWVPDDACRVTSRELLLFEQLGRELELC